MKIVCCVFDMFSEIIKSIFYGFVMMCVYTATNALMDISKSLDLIKSSTENVNHYLFVLNRELKIYNSIWREASAVDVSSVD
jgi:hypothetical protein